MLGNGDSSDEVGLGAGSLFKHLDDALLIKDHHEWTTYVGDQITRSKDSVWDILLGEWWRNCLSDEVAASFAEAIRRKLEEPVQRPGR